MTTGAVSLNRYAWDILHSQVMYHTERVQGQKPDAGAEEDCLWALLKAAYEEHKGEMDVSTVDLHLILGLARGAATAMLTMATVLNRRMAELDPDAEQLDLLELMVELGQVIDEELL